MKKLLFLLILLQQTMAQKTTSFEIQGHRGCRGLMPENTIEAFKKAIDLGVETLEMDVIISKDRKVVVSHEPQFNPAITTKPDGSFFKEMNESNLYLLNYSEITKYDVGLKFNLSFPEQKKIAAYKPLLKEVIDEVNAYLKTKGRASIKYNIEIKSLPNEYNLTQPEVNDFVDLVLKTIGKKIQANQLTLQSFDFNVLKRLNELNIKQKKYDISVLIEPEDNNEIDFIIEKLGFKPDIWSPYYKVMNTENVKYLHKLNIKVIPWTVNTEKDMEYIKSTGCDGLISDYPNKAIKFQK